MISVISCSDLIIAVDPSFPFDFQCVAGFIIGLDNQPVDTDSSKASGLASGFQESMNVNRGTVVNTSVTLHVHQSFLYFTLVNNIILQNKGYTKIHLQLDKSSNQVEKQNECFIIISLLENVHYLYARAKLSGECPVYFGPSLSR